MLQDIELDKKGFKLTCCQNSRNGRGSRSYLYAKYVIAADGGNSRTLRRFLPSLKGLPFGTGMQLHYRGKVDLDPHHYNVFFYPDMGFYCWANIKDDDIHVGVGGIGTKKQHTFEQDHALSRQRQQHHGVETASLPQENDHAPEGNLDDEIHQSHPERFPPGCEGVAVDPHRDIANPGADDRCQLDQGCASP